MTHAQIKAEIKRQAKAAELKEPPDLSYLPTPWKQKMDEGEKGQDDYYRNLQGAKIIKAGIQPPDEEGECWPYFVIQLTNGQRFKIEVSCDEEGNRPGFLFGIPEHVVGG